MADKHRSVTSSTYSGDSTSVRTAASKDADARTTANSKIDSENLISSAESAKKKRRDNKEAAQAREAAGKANK
jgi:hypothetical protein